MESVTETMLRVLGTDPPLLLKLAKIGSIEFEVTLPATGATGRLRDRVLGVLAPTASARRDACRVMREDVDIGVTEWTKITKGIIALRDPVERFTTLLEYRTRTVRAHYAGMVARWRAEHRFSVKDLHAFPPAIVMRHLRLNPGFGDLSGPSNGTSDAANFDWSRGATALVAEENVDTAFERFATLPLPMPEVIERALLDSDPEARRTFVHDTLRTPMSPVRVVHVLRMLCLFGETEPVYRRLARHLARFLGSAECQLRVELLHHLIAETYAAALAGKSTTALADGTESEGQPSTTADADLSTRDAWLLSSWHHASRFFDALEVVGADLAEAAHWVSSLAEQRTSALFSSEPREVHDIVHPSLLRFASFVIGGLQYATRGTTVSGELDTAVQTVRASLMDDTRGPRTPYLDVFRDLQRHPNRFASWTQPTRNADGTLFVGNTEFVQLSDTPDRLRADALAALEADPPDARPWILLSAVDRGEPLIGPHAQRFREVVSPNKIPEMLIALGDVARVASIRIAIQARADADDQWRSEIREALFAAAAKARSGERLGTLGSRRSDADDLTDLQTAVLEAVYVLSHAEPSAAGALKMFMQDLSRLSQMDAAYLRRMRGFLEDLVLERPRAEVSSCISLLLEARGL